MKSQLGEAMIRLKAVGVVVEVPIGTKVDHDRSGWLWEAALVLGKPMMAEADCTIE